MAFGVAIADTVSPAAIVDTLRRARQAILGVSVAYAIGVLAGAGMVHTGSGFALGYRDRIVARAQSSVILEQDRAGRRIRAALLDFGANSLLSAVPTTAVGIFNAGVYVIVVYRGWIGGIVSVDRNHVSRLMVPRKAAYYLSALVLQLIPYMLSGAAGVHMGQARKRAKGRDEGLWLFGVPKHAWLDALRIYVLVVPLFFFASLWEFAGPWR